eukprot:7777274-Pyramimonas_sp.AAC.1
MFLVPKTAPPPRSPPRDSAPPSPPRDDTGSRVHMYPSPPPQPPFLAETLEGGTYLATSCLRGGPQG